MVQKGNKNIYNLSANKSDAEIYIVLLKCRIIKKYIYTMHVIVLLMDKKFTNAKDDIRISLKQPSKIIIRLNLWYWAKVTHYYISYII